MNRESVCTVGAQQGLKLSQQADGVELPEEPVIAETVPQLDNEAADESGELQLHTHTHNISINNTNTNVKRL